MRPTHRVVLGLFLGLVVFAGSAAAECAWVLWSRYNLVNLTLGKPTQQGRWQIESAAPTHAACNDAARARAVRMAEPPPASGNARTRVMDELIGGGFSVRTEFKDSPGASASVEFRCYPERFQPDGIKESED